MSSGQVNQTLHKYDFSDEYVNMKIRRSRPEMKLHNDSKDMPSTKNINSPFDDKLLNYYSPSSSSTITEDSLEL